jgi:hypothetical protein
MAEEIAKHEVEEIHNQFSRPTPDRRRERAQSVSASSERGRSKTRRKGTLEKLVDKIDGRRKRRKDRKQLGSGSSSSSSAGSFCVAARLADRRMDGFPTWSLPDNSTLRKVYRQSKGHKGAYVASKPFEQWVPAHVGKALPVAERRALLKHREKECTRDPTIVLESIQCFWLAHSLVGHDIPPQAAQAHNAVLSRLHSEYDLEFVVQYERHLHAHILEMISDGTPVGFKDVLGTVSDTIVQRIVAQRFRAIDSRLRNPDQSRRYEVAANPKGGMERPQVAAIKKDTSDRKTPICLSHDLVKSKSCANAHNGKCLFVHLDTRKAEEAKRFAAATKAYEQRGVREARPFNAQKRPGEPRRHR